MGRIIIVGGYGAFGAHVAERLAREPSLNLVVAGRSLEKARAQAARLNASGAPAKLQAVAFDARQTSAEQLRELAPTVVINASGPFQAQDYMLARNCIAAGCHYVDLADARSFVCGIGELDEQARAAGVSVISGASSVPGLSSAAVLQMAAGFEKLDEVHIGISPGNSFDPGLATVASIIGAAGQPFTTRAGGKDITSHGWAGLRRYTFPEIGTRWMSEVDVPDLTLMTRKFPRIQTVRFTAGLEVSLFHLGMWGVSRLVRAGLLRDGTSLAAPMMAVKRSLSFLGSDAGGMFVRVAGRDGQGTQRKGSWHLIARRGHGPYVPGIASVILAKRMAAGQGPPAGAMACFGLFSLAEFEAEIADLDITCTLDREG
jgi:saccharopine dehydrogenase-like NADP-dependent oxidoreductase